MHLSQSHRSRSKKFRAVRRTSSYFIYAQDTNQSAGDTAMFRRLILFFQELNKRKIGQEILQDEIPIATLKAALRWGYRLLPLASIAIIHNTVSQDRRAVMVYYY